MKMFEKVKKCIMGVETFMLALATKAFASNEPRMQALYGPPPFENERLSIATIILRVVKFFIIPIALLVGLIIYFKKSKSGKKNKILVTIGILVITAILYFVINKLVY